jgi:hypothetical protein
MSKPNRSDKNDEYIRFRPYQAVGAPTNQPQRHELIGRIVVVAAIVVLIVIAGIALVIVLRRH